MYYELLLIKGEACLKVQDPEMAIDAYQLALNIDSSDSNIADKLGYLTKS